MKNLLLFLTAITLYSSATAQVDRGRMMLGGSFNTQNSTSSGSDTTGSLTRIQTNKNAAGNVSLRYGYFLAEGFMLGLLGGFSNSLTEDKTNWNYTNSSSSNILNKTTSQGYSAGLFSRYYKMLGRSHVAIFGDLSALYGAGDSEFRVKIDGVDVQTPSESKYKSFSALIRPGITYFLTNIIAVEAFFGNVGYYYTKTEDKFSVKNSRTSSGFNSRLDFSLSSVSLGINFYLGGTNTGRRRS